jgi:uncharacterized DUF497 family protein
LSAYRLAAASLCIYNNQVRISYDPDKREKTLADRGLDFEDALLVFEGITVEVEDTRRDYGEPRVICYGTLSGRVVVVGYTPRGTVRHIFSMRKANTREQARLAPFLEI